MKKILTMIIIILFSAVLSTAIEIRMDFRGSYFNSFDNAFEDIYGGGLTYDGEIAVEVWKGLELWFGGSYFNKKGGMTFSEREIELKVIPIGGGIGFRKSLSKRISIFGEGGAGYFLYSEESPVGDIREGNFGFMVGVGGLLEVGRFLFINAFIKYSYCKVKPADYEVNLGGITAGIGIGFYILRKAIDITDI